MGRRVEGCTWDPAEESLKCGVWRRETRARLSAVWLTVVASFWIEWSNAVRLD